MQIEWMNIPEWRVSLWCSCKNHLPLLNKIKASSSCTRGKWIAEFIYYKGETCLTRRELLLLLFVKAQRFFQMSAPHLLLLYVVIHQQPSSTIMVLWISNLDGLKARGAFFPFNFPSTRFSLFISDFEQNYNHHNHHHHLMDRFTGNTQATDLSHAERYNLWDSVCGSHGQRCSGRKTQLIL